MAVLTTSNEFKYENGKGNNDFSTHEYKLMLMSVGYVFNKDTHGTLADISGEASGEITAAGGYARKVLVVDAAWAQDNVNDRAVVTWVDPVYTASGEAFDNFGSALLYNETHAFDLIVGHIDFEATVTIPDGLSYKVENIAYESV